MSSKEYATRYDGMYRAFDRACKEAVLNQDPLNGPTTTLLAGALMTSPGHNEDKLGQNWKDFVNMFPDFAYVIRRGAAQLRISDNEPLRPALADGAKTGKKYLLVSNPDYVDGRVLQQNEAGRCLAKKVKPVVRQPQKARGKESAAEEVKSEDVDDSVKEEDDDGK